MPKRSLGVVMNARAAQDDQLRLAIAQIRRRAHDVDVRVCWESGDMARFAAELAPTCDALVIAGGDGSINEAINGLPGFDDVMLGVLPYGTANDFAQACGIPVDDPLAALTLAAEADPVAIDLGNVNNRLFVNAATGGYGAEVTVQTAEPMKNFLGGFAYFLTGLAQLGNVQGCPTRITAPDFSWEGELLGIGIGNGRQAGGGFQFAEAAMLNDGLFDVMLFPGRDASHLKEIIADWLRKHRIQQTEHLITVAASWLTVETETPLHVNLDGEPMQGDTFRFEIRERVLPVCLPASAPVLPM